MALQRKNFRCPRDGIAVSPLKGTVTSLVLSHAEFPPRQRKRVQVGSTNLFRSVSSPELPSPSASPQPMDDDGDLTLATHHACETNVALVKASMNDLSRRYAATSGDRSTGLVVRTEKRRLHELAVQAQPQTNDASLDTDAQWRQAASDNDTHLESDGTAWSRTPDATLERTFFLETRQKLFNAFVERYGSVRAVFKAFDRDANGLISFQHFADMVAASEVALSPVDVARVFRHVDVNGDNSIEYREFSEMFTASEYVEQASAYSPSKAKAAAVTIDPTSSLALKFRAPLDLSPRTRERMKQLRLKVNGELVLKHGRDVSVHGGKTENLLIYAFKQFDVDNDGFLSYDQVKRALGKDYLQLDMDPTEMDEMVRLIDRNADEQISMKEFVQYFGAGERELPTDLLDNGRRKALAALHFKANVDLPPRPEHDLPRPVTVATEMPEPPMLRGCLQEQLAHRVATSPMFQRPPRLPRVQTSNGALGSSSSTPTLRTKSDLGPTVTPLLAVSQDRHAYWREQRTDWTRVGVGGDGMSADAALFASAHERMQTTTTRAFSPMRRGVNSGDVYRDDPSTSESEAGARVARRQARHDRTQSLLMAMDAQRSQDQRMSEWKARAKVRLGAARQFEYLERVHDQEQRVAMREQHMAKRHGGVRFHRMWAGSADSQFNMTHVTDSDFSQ